MRAAIGEMQKKKIVDKPAKTGKKKSRIKWRLGFFKGFFYIMVMDLSISWTFSCVAFTERGIHRFTESVRQFPGRFLLECRFLRLFQCPHRVPRPEIAQRL